MLVFETVSGPSKSLQLNWVQIVFGLRAIKIQLRPSSLQSVSVLPSIGFHSNLIIQAWVDITTSFQHAAGWRCRGQCIGGVLWIMGLVLNHTSELAIWEILWRDTPRQKTHICIYIYIYLFKCTPCFVPAYAFFPYYLSRRNHGLSFQLNLNDRFANTIKIKGFRGSCRTKIPSHSVAYHCPSLSCIHVAIIFRWSYNMEYDEELALPLHQQEDESERQAIQGFQRGSAGFKRVHYHSNQ